MCGHQNWNAKMKSYICCSHAGGQGKTTTSQLLYTVNRQVGMPLKLWSADYTDSEGLSKLGRLFPGDVVELGVGESISNVRSSNDRSAGVKYWDKLGHALLSDGGVFDIGANVIEQIIDWANVRDAKSILKERHAPDIVAFLVCKAERRAIADMSELVRNFGVDQALPVSKIVIVQNEAGGSFDRLPLESTISMIPTDVPVEYFTMPACHSEMWSSMEVNFLSLDKAISMTPDRASRELDLDPFEAISAVSDLNDWLETCKEKLKAIHIL